MTERDGTGSREGLHAGPPHGTVWIRARGRIPPELHIKHLAAIAGATLALAAGCGSTQAEVGGDAARLETLDTTVVTVARVTDGDTIRLRDGRRVRLVQIDAPEDPSECYGRAATKALRRLAPPGSTVRIGRDPALDDRDGYGRLLRYVVAGGALVNVVLVREGAAVAYFFGGARGSFAEQLQAATIAARRARRGLWHACRGAKLDPRRGSLTGPA